MNSNNENNKKLLDIMYFISYFQPVKITKNIRCNNDR